MSILFEHREEFDDRNTFLQVVLGMLSCAREILAVLPLLEGEHQRSCDTPPSLRLFRTENAQEDDDLVFLLLGLASLSRTVSHHAQNNAAASSAPPATSPNVRHLRSLLEI